MTRTRMFRIAAAAALGSVSLASAAQAQGTLAPVTLSITLDDAVKRAVTNNPDLAVVRLGIDVQASRVVASRGAFEPVLSTIVGRSSIATPPTSSFLGTEPIDTSEWFSTAGVRQRLTRGGGTWSVSWDGSRVGTNNPFSSFDPSLQSSLLLAFSQPLFKDRRIDEARHQSTIAERHQVNAELLYREAEVQTVAAVKRAYWTLKAALANVTVQQRSVELAEDLVRQNRARVTVGQVPPIDLVQSEAEVAQRRENLIRANEGAQNAEDALRRLIMDPSDVTFWQVRLDPVEQPSAAVPPPDLTHAVSVAMKERYDLTRARQDLEIAATNVDFFANQKLPDVRLEASYRAGGIGGTEFLRTGPFPGTVTGRSGRSFGDALGQLFTNDLPTWSVGMTMNYSLGRRFEKANVARADLERQQVAQRIASLQLQAAETIRQAWRQIQSATERVEAARAGDDLASQRLEVEQRRFEVGLSTTFLVTQAQRDLLQAQVSLLQAMLDHQSALVNFEAVQLAAPSLPTGAGNPPSPEVVALPAPTPAGVFRPSAGAF